ncbi:MAG: NADH-quinone oxidoreductase subunit C [Bacteroidota bacterium]
MNNEQLIEKIRSLDSTINISEGPQYLTLNVEAEALSKTAFMLKNDSDLSFDYLFCLTGNDLSDAYSVVYHLESSKHGHVIVLKVKAVSRELPVLDTVSNIWITADFHEREVYDLIGINFTNHPDMRRIFLDEEDWVGHPLRKDYTDNNIVSR